MALSAKYFITDQRGNYIDWSAQIQGFSLLGKEVQLIGGAGDDVLYVQAGTSADVTNVGGGDNTLYLTGNLAEYTQVIDQETSVYTLTRIAGLADGQSEVVRFTANDNPDVVYFADGHITTKFDALGSQLHNGTAFQAIQAAWLTAGGTPASPVTTAATEATNPAKVFIVDAQGLDVPMLMQPGQAMVITGSGKVDTVYINAGTSVNASNLGGDADRLYLLGNLSNYEQIIDQETGVYTLTRTVNSQTETVQFTVADEDDVVYFADGHITVNFTAPGSQLHNGTEFQPIQAGWLTAGGTPLPLPTVTITAASDSALKAGETATLTFTLSEAASDFAVGDVTVSGGGALSNFSGSGTTYTATFTPTASTTTTATISVAADGFTNAESEANTASLPLSLSIDTAVPTLTITSNVSAVKIGETATVTFTFSEVPVGFVAGDVTTTGGTLSDPAVTADTKVYTATFTPSTNSEGNASITVASGAYTDAAGNTGGAGTTPTISIDTLAPAVTLTGGAYSESTGVLSVSGTNFDKLGVANGTDVKSQLDWTKFTWDINGDGSTTADKTFAAGDISSAIVSNATGLTVTLTLDAKTALEGLPGFGSTGGSDALDVTAGFAKDAAGNVATTDALSNGAIVADNAAPTSTVTSAAYNNTTGVLTLTGTNFDTIGAATNTTDIKSQLNWSNLVWDINGDDSTTTNKTFAESDISTAVVTNATTLTITLTSGAKTALEGTSGFGSVGNADTV
ncbi:MAG: Ig-like domain-containing protein, partial [Rhodocyclaceae bacterium]|nr:Ig-like domain-containing protein [Rhodocyclaceae bacterium]